MTDYLNLGGGDDSGSGDYLGGGDGGYLGLDDPPAPTEAPAPPGPPAMGSSTGGGDFLDAGYLDGGAGDGGYLDSPAGGAGGGFLADAPGGYLDSAPAGGTATMIEPAPPATGGYLGEPQSAPAGGYGGQAMQAAPATPQMGGFSVEAPRLPEVRQQRAPSTGAVRGDLSSLVLDVDVQVEVYFGDATLTVEEFLEMGPGSVVELDHPIEAPVELRVRGKLIARGQLVTINGNYGLRVTDMVNEEQ